MTLVVELSGIRIVHDGRAVLDVPDLFVAQGEVLAIIGPNGAGKSSLLRVIGALEAPAAGTVRFQGAPVVAESALAVRRRMASVFQEPLLADTRVFDNVAMGLRFRDVARGQIETRVARWLARFAIAQLASRRARTLSGGEAQARLWHAHSSSNLSFSCWTSPSRRSISRRAKPSSATWAGYSAKSASPPSS
jgi:tungstate transport system ATP-binding protein